MSVRELWNRLWERTEEHDGYARLEEAQARAEQTGDERAERTKYRLLLEANAKKRMAHDMRESGMKEAAETLEREAVDLSERVACIEPQRDDERSKESELLADLFGTRRRAENGG